MHPMSRIAAACALVVAGLIQPASAGAADWTETIPADAAQADLDALYRGLKSGHYDLYAHVPKA
ncbi:MAG: hypothetical protein KAH44_17055, partial [Oricola sp.]|nr:hypothetical protein [Oricola sp.]